MWFVTGTFLILTCYTLEMRRAVSALSPLLTLLFLLATSLAQAAPDVFVAYPDPNARVAYARVILEGSVTPGASLTIDGQAVAVGPDGLFMEWWPLKPGTNDLRLVARQAGQSGSLTLRVVRTGPRVLAATPTAIDPATTLPRESLEYWDAATDSPAERSVKLAFQGSPGGKAAYRVGAGPAIAMKEDTPGTYAATYVMENHARLHSAAIRYTLTGKDGKTVAAVAPGRLSSAQTGPRLGTQKEGSVQGLGLNEATVVATDLDGQPLLYPRSGMTFTLVGRQGNDVRARLAPGVSALITASQLNIGPGSLRVASGGALVVEGVGSAVQAVPPPDVAAAPVLAEAAAPINPYEAPLAPVSAPASPPEAASVPPLPSAPVSDLAVRIPLGGVRLPFTVVQDNGGKRLTVTLYGKLARPLTGSSAPGDPLLQGVQVRAVALGVTSVTLNLTAPQAWGFTANYDQGDLRVTVRRPPVLTQANLARPLEGRVLTLDPGHGGSQKGGAGSLRTHEKGLVLPIALRVADLLRAQGATVHLTRTADVTLGLYERGLLAESSRSELLVSIHANALPDGRDPRGIRGPEVYYTHPQAEPVAAAILKRLRQTLPELGPGDGLKPDAFLALTRPSTQISLLVELAYLTDAGNLRLLSSPAGRERFAQAVAAGIVDFYAAQATTARN